MHSLGETLLAFALLHFVLKAKLACYSMNFTSCFCIPVTYNEKDLFLVLVLEGLVRHHRAFSLIPFSISGWGIDLDYCDGECSVLEMNQGHSVIFEIAPRYCISDSVDYEGYSISSKGFLPTVVDIMVI